MRVSEKQVLVLLDILQHATNFKYSFAGYKQNYLIKLYMEIMNQQSNKLVELDCETPTSVTDNTDISYGS
jgi:hypothetical protein